MSRPAFYIQKYVRDASTGGFVPVGERKDIERDFGHIRYKSCTGLNLLGEAQVYAETFVEDEKTYVYIPDNPVRKQTEITLTLYFFGANPETSVASEVTDEDMVDAAQASYEAFWKYISGGFCCYWDTVRKRKVMMYQVSSPTVSSDKLYGFPYKQVSIKFKNVYGRSFALADPVFGITEEQPQSPQK